jgi:Bacterial protein of unknown function (DUF894).
VTTPRLGGPFWRLWTATTLSALGDGFTLVALPLLAARLTRDPSRIALVAGAEYTAWLLFGLVSGALADRWERRRIMAVTDLVRIGLFGAFAVLVVADRATVALLVVLAFCAGTLGILNENAASAFLPTLVTRDQLERRTRGCRPASWSPACSSARRWAPYCSWRPRRCRSAWTPAPIS